jgi:outer membrane protein assembly factor BamB
MNRCVLIFGTCCLFCIGTLHGADWSRFRGPGSTGVSADTGLPVHWNANSNVVWKADLPGAGSSSPITWSDHVYVTCYSGYGIPMHSSGGKSRLTRHLVCLHRDDGRILWQADLAASGNEADYDGYLHLHGYASHTPLADSAGVYVFYGASGAASYSHDGELMWRADCGSMNHEWGSGASPLLFKNLVIIPARIESDSLIALDTKTGRELWRRRAGFGHGTPTLVSFADAQELVFVRNKQVVGADPATGDDLWTCSAEIDYAMPIPLAHNGVVYVMTRGHSIAIRAGGRGDVTESHLLWHLNRGSHIATPVYYEGHLYFPHDEQGVVYCVNAATGELVYEHRLPNTPRHIYASPIIADGLLYYVSRNDGVFVLAAKPEYSLLARNVIEGDTRRFTATPAICRGRLLLRSDQALYCLGSK